MSELYVRHLANLRHAMVQLRYELGNFEDITNNGGPNEAMRIAHEMTVELGECEFEKPSGKGVIMQGLIDEALHFLDPDRNPE
jgi:hypothetical protein